MVCGYGGINSTIIILVQNNTIEWNLNENIQLKSIQAIARAYSIQLIIVCIMKEVCNINVVIHPLIVGQEWGIQQIKHFHMRKEANWNAILLSRMHVSRLFYGIQSKRNRPWCTRCARSTIVLFDSLHALNPRFVMFAVLKTE